MTQAVVKCGCALSREARTPGGDSYIRSRKVHKAARALRRYAALCCRFSRSTVAVDAVASICLVCDAAALAHPHSMLELERCCCSYSIQTVVACNVCTCGVAASIWLMMQAWRHWRVWVAADLGFT